MIRWSRSQIPGGTGSFSFVISPRFAPLPPAVRAPTHDARCARPPDLVEGRETYFTLPFFRMAALPTARDGLAFFRNCSHDCNSPWVTN